jgi:hypothetical protein
MGEFLCKAVHYIQNVSAISSVLTLTAMSTERCVYLTTIIERGERGCQKVGHVSSLFLHAPPRADDLRY